VETLAALRRGRGLPGKKKLLLVLDQFEQWLHARRGEPNAELVEALRQCDGQHVQCLVLVRDDFGMAATRFMSDLEIPIVQGHNFATVDRFDPRHARKVLTEFGRAFGCLPATPAEPTLAHEQFLDQALAGLAQDGQVISVRLVLFVEMVKGRPWAPATLKVVGGIEGLGVTFLEETLGARAANPEHRRYQKPARAVLQALLPEQGSDIRGHMRSHQELLAASGLSQGPQAFGDLLRILDTELRLITPTDPEGAEETPSCCASQGGPAPALPANPGAQYYQLTHDYLVPALRQWLTAKQRQTRRGRAELLLAERAGVWDAPPQKRHLPTWWEWLTIRLHTRPRDWTPPQRRMMRAAGRRRLAQAGVLVLVLGLLGWAAVEASRYLRAVELVRALGSVDTAGVPRIVEDLPPCRKWADPRLRTLIKEGDRKRELHARLALLPVDPGQASYLYELMLDADRRPEDFWVVCHELMKYRQEVVQEQVVQDLSAFLKNETNPDRRLRAACALALYDPRNPLWTRDNELCDEVANKLLKEPATHSEVWLQGTKALPISPRALRHPIGDSFLRIFSDPTRLESERAMAAQLRLICRRLEATTEEWARFILDSDDPLLYDRLLPHFLARGDEAVQLMSRELARTPSPEMSEVEKDTLAKRRAKAAVFLLQFEQQEPPGPVQQAGCLWPLLRDGSDPRLRDYLIPRFSQAGADPETLVRQYEEEKDVVARRALLESLGHFKERLPSGRREALVTRLKLLETYRDDPDAGIHSALEGLLRRWGLDAQLENIDRQQAGKPAGRRR
jgi:hypothetical protein